MGAARDNDAIDLTDNDIAQLGNFPLQPRLRTLFVAQNRIATIQANLSSSIPNLTTLVLTKNRISELAELDPLGGFKKLVYLSLKDNPVTTKEVRADESLAHNVRLMFPRVCESNRRSAPCKTQMRTKTHEIRSC
jgi:Leucine-rich repeat (LRR) protein